MWSIAVNYRPNFQGRTTLTKIFAMITTIDDVYDVYGTLHELEQFTDVVSRSMYNSLLVECFFCNSWNYLFSIL